MTRRLWRAGVALVALYAAVAVGAHALTGGSVGGRPLFDGFAPPVPYRWVKPPPELAAGNQPPEPAERLVPLGEQGSETTNASTTDAQIIVSLPQGALPPHRPDTAVAMRIIPRDAGTLGALAPDLKPVSNAYQVTLAYQASQESVSQVSPSATIALTAASLGDTLLYSADGQQWAQQPSRPFGATDGLLGTFLGTGYYLVTASPAVVTTTTTIPSAVGGGSGAVLAALVVAAAAIGIGFGVVRVRRRRRRKAAARAARRGKRRRS